MKIEKIEFNESEAKIIKIIDSNFLYQNPSGEILKGFLDGFLEWSLNNHKSKSINEKLAIFHNSIIEIDGFRDDKYSFIDGTNKMKNSYEKCYIDKLYFFDMFNIKNIGKSKLSIFLKISKRHGDENSTMEIVKIIKDRLLDFIKKGKFDAVGFIPPSTKRAIQIMHILEEEFGVNLPKIKINKIPSTTPIAQKDLNSKQERIENAKNTFEVLMNSNDDYKNILLIDDMVGSGATLNETAKKIKMFLPNTSITAFTVVGEISSENFPKERGI